MNKIHLLTCGTWCKRRKVVGDHRIVERISVGVEVDIKAIVMEYGCVGDRLTPMDTGGGEGTSGTRQSRRRAGCLSTGCCRSLRRASHRSPLQCSGQQSLSGPIPADFTILAWSRCWFTGVTCTCMGDCTAMAAIRLPVVGLVGHIHILFLGSNLLSGPIPVDFAGKAWSQCWFNGVTYNAIRLPGVSLVGPIPAETLGRLSSLCILSLCSNCLSGTIPVNFAGRHSSLRVLSLRSNCLSGTIPVDFAGLV